MSAELDNEIASLLGRYPEIQVQKAISSYRKKADPKILTFVVNSGMHALPDDVIRGDLFVYSEGNVDLSPDKVEGEIRKIARRAVKFLQSNIWEKIYFVPSGHPLLVVSASLVCYRVTRVNPIIVSYVDGLYIDVDFDVRRDIVRGSTGRS